MKISLFADIKNMKKAASANEAKAKHKKYVLNTLNNGEIKDLQVLPTIGAKTAYQMVTYR